MPTAPDCVVDRPLSCAILEIVQEMQASPDLFEVFGLLVIPAVAAVGSVVASGVALWIALQSRKDRDVERFEHAVGSMLGSIGAFIGELRVYGKTKTLWVEKWASKSEDEFGPLPPDDSVVVASVLTARMMTRDKEARRMLNEVGWVIERYAETESKIRLEALTKVQTLVVAWMSESEDRRLVINLMKDLKPEEKEKVSQPK